MSEEFLPVLDGKVLITKDMMHDDNVDELKSALELLRDCYDEAASERLAKQILEPSKTKWYEIIPPPTPLQQKTAFVESFSSSTFPPEIDRESLIRGWKEDETT